MVAAFGYIRFSFLGRNDTRISRSVTDTEDRAAILFDPLRMEERFHFFEKITLPSLRAQLDQDFRVVVLASKVMPDVYKQRLDAAVADVPQIEVLYSDAWHVNDALTPWIEREAAPLKTRTVHFRLDDDDAICAQMIKLLKRDAERARPDELLTYPRGLYLTAVDGKPRLIRKFEPYIAIAWARVNEPGQVITPYQGKHGSQYTVVPSMMDPRPFAYIHVAHESSDTKLRQQRKLRKAAAFDPGHGKDEARAKARAALRRFFPCFTLKGLERIITDAPSARAMNQAAAE